MLNHKIMKTKTILLTILISVLIVFTNSCEKHYPKDIPIWLKNKIKELKKKDCDQACRIVEFENSKTGEIIYLFDEPGAFHYDFYYDYFGNKLCFETQGICCYNEDLFLLFGNCSGRIIEDFKVKRHIRSPKCR